MTSSVIHMHGLAVYYVVAFHSYSNMYWVTPAISITTTLHVYRYVPQKTHQSELVQPPRTPTLKNSKHNTGIVTNIHLLTLQIDLLIYSPRHKYMHTVTVIHTIHTSTVQ